MNEPEPLDVIIERRYRELLGDGYTDGDGKKLSAAQLISALKGAGAFNASRNGGPAPGEATPGSAFVQDDD